MSLLILHGCKVKSTNNSASQHSITSSVNTLDINEFGSIPHLQNKPLVPMPNPDQRQKTYQVTNAIQAVVNKRSSNGSLCKHLGSNGSSSNRGNDGSSIKLITKCRGSKISKSTKIETCCIHGCYSIYPPIDLLFFFLTYHHQ